MRVYHVTMLYFDHNTSWDCCATISFCVDVPHRHIQVSIVLIFTCILSLSQFEDECRNLLGASAYVLFTIDKLISQLVKQTLAILANETCMKLLALYQYEYSRSK